MSGKRYTEEFKVTAVKQVIDRGHPAAEVAGRPFGAPTSLRKRIDQHFPKYSSGNYCEFMTNRTGCYARRPLRRSASTASSGQASSATLQSAGYGSQKSQ